MNKNKYTGRTDANQKDIVKALRGMGCSVTLLSGLGGGIPDLLIGWKNKTVLMEVKMPGKALNAREEAWWNKWDGKAFIVRTEQEAIEIMEVVCL